MQMAEPVVASWKARLSLQFEERGGKTVLAGREHDGPLVVQKPLYPEGPQACHAIIVHPPAGIAGGDELTLEAAVSKRAHALLTTPGAGKWYRSAGAWARQSLRFNVEGSLEWLPQETIVFDGARAAMQCEVELGAEASYIGWECLCLGRTGSGERFERGRISLRTALRRNGKLLRWEQGGIAPEGRLMASAAGLGGHSVCATFLAAAPGLAPEHVAACRQVDGVSVTLLPGVLVARHLGDSGEGARQRFVDLWKILRPALLGCAAVEPRIWRT